MTDISLENQSIEHKLGEHNVCIICLRHKSASRMKDVYGGECPHDRFVFGYINQ